MKTQLLKGILEPCILKIISKKDVYGYEITKVLNENGMKSITLGTIYPLLSRLEKHEYINSHKIKSDFGPDRKYYDITVSGLIYLNEFSDDWIKLDSAVNNIFSDNIK
jgi:PadR family transcriptional regulator PadR